MAIRPALDALLEALGRAKRDPRARAPLTALLEDPDATVRRLAQNALGKLKKG